MRSKIRLIALQLSIVAFVLGLLIGCSLGFDSAQNSANSGIHLDATPTAPYILEPESILIHRPDRVEVIYV